MSDDRTLPRYPVYVPSKNRADVCYTAKFLRNDGVPFQLVVEPHQFDTYAALWGEKHCLVMDRDHGGLLYARNWIRTHAESAGHERHWQLDDNMERTRMWHKGKRIPCSSGVAMRVVEDFSDRFTNVGISGLSYTMFQAKMHKPPFFLNCHVYSFTLINHAMPFRWRQRYNDDTDLCLQALAGGWCTVLLNAFMVDKKRTMVVKGGNTHDLYQGDGRLKMARALERLWPGVVEVDRRWQRPQHVIKDQWRRFDTHLIPRAGIDISALPPIDNYGLELTKLRDPKNANLSNLAQAFLERQVTATLPGAPEALPDE